MSIALISRPERGINERFYFATVIEETDDRLVLEHPRSNGVIVISRRTRREVGKNFRAFELADISAYEQMFGAKAPEGITTY